MASSLQHQQKRSCSRLYGFFGPVEHIQRIAGTQLGYAASIMRPLPARLAWVPHLRCSPRCCCCCLCSALCMLLCRAGIIIARIIVVAVVITAIIASIIIVVCVTQGRKWATEGRQEEDRKE